MTFPYIHNSHIYQLCTILDLYSKYFPKAREQILEIIKCIEKHNNHNAHIYTFLENGIVEDYIAKLNNSMTAQEVDQELLTNITTNFQGSAELNSSKKQGGFRERINKWFQIIRNVIRPINRT